MRLFNPRQLNFIFLVPVAVAASDGGCMSSSTDLAGTALDQNAALQVLVDNTVTTPDPVEPQPYVYVNRDGSVSATNTPHGGTSGTWSVDENGVVCVQWSDLPDQPRLCDRMTYVDSTTVLWGGQELALLSGNPQGL